MTDSTIVCRFQAEKPATRCLSAATYIVCEPLTGYAFLVCDVHFAGLVRTLQERCGCLKWTVQRINGEVFQVIKGRPPQSNRGVTKLGG